MKQLVLTMTGKWFDMILSGEKKEEYRECRAAMETEVPAEPSTPP